MQLTNFTHSVLETKTSIIKVEKICPPSPTVIVVLYAVVVFLFSYLADPARPGPIWKNGWYEIWSDQSAYLDMVKGISQGNLGHFTYPSLYPLLGWCFWLYSPDPFVIVDLMLFCCFIFFSLRIFATFVNATLSIAASLILIHASVATFVTPWTSTVSASALTCIVYLLLCQPANWKTSSMIGLCLGAMFGARIGDVAIGSLAVASQWWIASDGRATVGRLLVITTVFAGFVGAVVAFNYNMSGLALGHYINAVQSADFNVTAAPWKLYGYALDPFLFAHETNPLARPLFVVLPLILLSPLGVVLLWRDRKPVAFVFIACVAGWLFIYLGSPWLTGLSLKYLSIHYAKILFPILIGCAMVSVTALAERAISWQSVCIYAAVILACVFLPHVPPTARKLNKSDMTVIASERGSEAWRAIDEDEVTRWDSGGPQHPGMTFDIHLSEAKWVFGITTDTRSSPGGIAHAMSVWRSDDGVHWRPVIAANNTLVPLIADYRFDPIRTRHLRLQVDQDSSDWWSIHELAVYGP